MKLTHLLKALCIALVLAFGGSLANGAPQASPSPTPSRDWVSHPVVVQVDKTRAVFAIGDIHADPGRLLGVLKALHIIDVGDRTDVSLAELKMPPNAILVVTGDMIDNGPRTGGSSLRVIAMLRALQDSAPAVNSRVILLMGNHEAEFLADWSGNKTEEFRMELEAKVRELRAQGKVQEAEAFVPRNVANCQGDLGRFLCDLPIAAKLSDWFFSHAGNTNGRTIAALSADIEAGFREVKNGVMVGFATPQLIGEGSILEARLNDNKPGREIWINKLFNGAKNPQALLADYANKLGVKHMVQGHQPGKVEFPDGQNRGKWEIFQRYGLLFLIDSGMSRGIEDNEDGRKSTGGGLRIAQAGYNGLDEVVTVWCARSDGKIVYDGSVSASIWGATYNIPIAARQCR
jgi:hypothetical protein